MFNGIISIITVTESSLKYFRECAMLKGMEAIKCTAQISQFMWLKRNVRRMFVVLARFFSEILILMQLNGGGRGFFRFPHVRFFIPTNSFTKQRRSIGKRSRKRYKHEISVTSQIHWLFVVMPQISGGLWDFANSMRKNTYIKGSHRKP